MDVHPAIPLSFHKTWNSKSENVLQTDFQLLLAVTENLVHTRTHNRSVTKPGIHDFDDPLSPSLSIFCFHRMSEKTQVEGTAGDIVDKSKII